MLFLNKIDTNSFVFSFWQNAYFIYLSFYIGLFTHCLFFNSFIQPYSQLCSLFLLLYMLCALHGISVGLCEFYNKHMPVLGIDRTWFNTDGRSTMNKYHHRGTLGYSWKGNDLKKTLRRPALVHLLSSEITWQMLLNVIHKQLHIQRNENTSLVRFVYGLINSPLAHVWAWSKNCYSNTRRQLMKES